MSFVSNPLDVNSNSKKNLGISKGETYWQCFIGQHEAPAGDKASEFEISLDEFSTDRPGGIDTSCIEDRAAREVFSVIGVFFIMIFG